LSAAKIEDWNWRADPNFAGRGAIIWNVKVKNVSDKPIHLVVVTLTTYGSDGKMLGTDFTLVKAIPPGESRESKSFADYYRREQRAEVKITDVSFAY
jgi:hypothetical protein